MDDKQKSIVVGAVLGAGLGALGGYLFSRGAEMANEEGVENLSLRTVSPGELVKLFISIMGVLRSVAEMGERA
ncbi:MAG: hypothetical protein PVF47_11750 [Anaerolineae bacterium]|jgi:hypothetical protein